MQETHGAIRICKSYEGSQIKKVMSQTEKIDTNLPERLKQRNY